MNITKLKLHELEELQIEVEVQINNVKYEEWKSKKYTKEEIIAMFHKFGFQVPNGVKIWRVHPYGNRTGGYGMEVGSYDHSCNVDSSTYIVLLVVSEDTYYIEGFSDMWISNPITI